MKLLEGKVILVTGAGRGLGRAHALLFAQQGASLVINDLGTDMSGAGRSSELAESVVGEIRAIGGAAVANTDDISSWKGAEAAVRAGIDQFGKLDGLVNNAGNLRKVELADLTEDDFDAITRVHLKGTFAITHHACHYWRERFLRGDNPKASVINTISDALLVSLPNYTIYGAAKAGIAHLTTCGSREALAYGVRINAYGPRALTRMAGPAFAQAESSSADAMHPMDAGNSSPLLAWLLSDQSQHVSGQVFNTVGGGIGLCTPWRAGELHWPPEGHVRFEPEAVGPMINADMFGCRFPDLKLGEPPGMAALKK
ncbi:MAG: short-chain dehydrogenase [Hydrocarboniphaga sp.]|uniref:SDR family NAD(P)-dependent oxidoreductase n=1 Tax=Hydrocarboniphaga sp. TaxID=2033016 RepID=UPI0026313904|nr:SDR family NAD(P)-dependent oxidoreductase [Hydrocarboniphaga sp.]MDB5970026.1 short-chain dehydrogenase [Hydrocarboniphaga sp.]